MQIEILNCSESDSRRDSNCSSLTGFAENSALDDGPDDRLHVTQSSLCGRSKELSLLDDALDRVFDSNADKGSSEVVHVRGQSGCGKSSIVEKLRESVVELNGFFVSGKFDHFRSQEPFSAIACAFADLCDLVSQSDDLVIVKNALEEALGSEIKVLLNLIGNLSSLTDELPEVKPNANAGHVFTRFKYLCQIFLNCLATANHPVCVFIDDIQCKSTSLFAICRDSVEIISISLQGPMGQVLRSFKLCLCIENRATSSLFLLIGTRRCLIFPSFGPH